jgi:hypothetical protein
MQQDGILPLSSVSISQPVSQTILQVNGNSGDVLFSIKPNGEFVPGPGINESRSLSEFSKFIYKGMTILGDSFSKTLEDKNKRIKELEEELNRIKSI